MTESSDERKEATATKRRWISLAEFVGVAGVAIAGLGLWANWSERRATDAERAVTTAAEQRREARLDVRGDVRDGGGSLLFVTDRHDIQDVRFAFPSALGVAAQHPPGDPAIDADWIAKPMLKLTDGGSDQQAGRLPVLATIRYWDGDRARTMNAIYDLIWRTDGRFLQGRAFKLEGLRLRQRGGSQVQLDALWNRPRR